MLNSHLLNLEHAVYQFSLRATYFSPSQDIPRDNMADEIRGN